MNIPSRTLDRKVLRFRLITVLTAIIVMTVAVMSLSVIAIFDRAIAPELENRTRLIGNNVRTDIQRIIQVGIPLESIGGIESFLDQAVAPFPEIQRVTVLSKSGEVIAETFREDIARSAERGVVGSIIAVRATRFSLPIIVGNSSQGEVVVEGSAYFVETRLRDVVLDVGVLSLVVVLLGVEVALMLAASAVWKPYGRLLRLLQEQRAGRFGLVARATGLGRLSGAIARLNEQTLDLVGRLRAAPETLRPDLSGITRGRPIRLRLSDIYDVRLVMLLYIFGAEITASFLPVYGARAARPDWLSPEAAAVLPIGLFLVGVAVLSPFAGGIVRRFGAKKVFVVTSLATVIALCAMGLARGIFGIAVARGIIALLYALATIACQQYALEADAEAQEYEGVSGGSASAAYFAMLFGGVFGGSVVGGVVSSLFSYQIAIFLGAVIVLTSAGLAVVLMEGRAGLAMRADTQKSRLLWPNRARLVRCLMLILAVAAPLSATTAVVVWYLTPMLLSTSGHSASEIARVVMLYYLLHVLVGPASRVISRVNGGAMAAIVLGSLMAGAALVQFDISAGILGYSLAIAVIGIGHALIRTPLLTLVVELSGAAVGPVNVLRGAERLGGLLGLGGAAIWLGHGAAGTSLLWLGGLSAAGGIVFLGVSVIISEEKKTL